jgi:hypothetical protein
MPSLAVCLSDYLSVSFRLTDIDSGKQSSCSLKIYGSFIALSLTKILFLVEVNSVSDPDSLNPIRIQHFS